MIVLGIDTSNYTTSMAFFDGTAGQNCSRLLPVQAGALGLRQSDAVFSHLKQLPQIAQQLFSVCDGREIAAVGVSTRPRAVEGSYMPCFLAGESHASVLASSRGVPLIRVSHQQGHIAAALYSAGRLELLDQPHFAWHLSGGTTELLLVQPDAGNVRATRIGGTTDLAAGQIIDRTGKFLGLAFPSGKALDALAQSAVGDAHARIKLRTCSFSLSGLENKMHDYAASGAVPEALARYVLYSIADAVKHATEAALQQYPGLPVVFSGGVASNSLLRQICAPLQPVFAAPQYSTDNAMGVAVLAWRLQHR